MLRVQLLPVPSSILMEWDGKINHFCRPKKILTKFFLRQAFPIFVE